MLPAWVGKYIGVPFAERGRGPAFDCWGLCRAVWAAEFALEVPSYAEGYRTLRDVAEIASMIARAATSSDWINVVPTSMRAGDAIVLRVYGQPFHVGVIVAPGQFLHIRRGVNASVERCDAPSWRSRVLGIYRHVRLAEAV